MAPAYATDVAAKHTPLPQMASIRPPTPGPMMRAALFIALFMAMPLPTSGGGSSSLTIAERVGKSTALATPRTSASRMSCQYCTRLVSVSQARIAACTPITTWTPTISRLVCVRSIRTPEKSVRMVTGSACATVTTPSAAGEPVRSRTSQAWVVRSSQPPHWATMAPTT